MINFSEEGMKTSFKIILNTQGIIIKEKGFFGTSYKDVYSKRYTDISSIKLDNKVLVYTLTFDNRTTEYFDKEIDARKIKMLCELGKTNPNELLRQIGSDNDNKQLSEFSVKELEDLVDRNKFAAASSTKYPSTALSTPWEKENNRVQVHFSQRDIDTDSYPQKPQAKEPSAPSCPPPIPTFSYYAIIEGQQRGPYNKEQFKRLVDANLITANTMIWCEGMGGWQKACEVDDMRVFFDKPATPPVTPGNGGCPPPPPCC